MAAPSRILALVTDAFGSYGGIACYNRDVLTALAELGHEVRVLPRLAEPEHEPLPAGLVQRRPRHNKLAYAGASLAEALMWRPDVIFNGHLYHGPLAVQLGRLVRAPVVSQLHGTEMWGTVSPAHAGALRNSAKVLAVSRDTRERACAIGVDGAQVEVVHNTVNPAFSLGDKAAARARFAGGAAEVVLTVGRLDTRGGGYKGHGRVIPLIAEMARAGRDVVYLIAGIGDDRARLEALAREHGVTDRVRFLGKVAQEDLPDLYRAADLFALPSTGEGFGIVYLEATACGTPVIGLDIGGVADALDDGALGTLTTAEGFAAAFPQALDAALGMNDAAHADLAARTFQQYGFPAFRGAVGAAFAPLLE